MKEALPYTQQLCRKYEEKDFIDLLNTNCSFKISEPSENIHFFEGHLKVGGEKISLGIESTIWSNCMLASGIILGKKQLCEEKKEKKKGKKKRKKNYKKITKNK